MSDFIIDTSQNLIKQTGPVCRDPYDHLGPEEWVQKQLDWCEQPQNISGRGLVDPIKKLQGELIGVEVGVCNGVTSELYAQEISNIKKLYAVDNYPSFVDWDGTRVTEERQTETMRRCKERLIKYSNIEFVYKTSVEFGESLEDNSIDFVFIDGDHSFNATLKDIQTYWPKVKKGGLFAGHDINLGTVDQAVKEFFKNIPDVQIKVVENNAWFLIK
jgi:predicted O-methyltransferase YrrM